MRLPFRVIDPKLRGNLPRYIAQCLIATVALFIVLWVEDALASAVIIAAIGSTAFVLFITPHNDMATPRHVLGGHAIALAVGALASIYATDAAFLSALQGALAVGAALFLMAATNTEHGPAASTALGVVVLGFEWSLALLLASSIVALVILHQLLRPWLRNLY